MLPPIEIFLSVFSEVPVLCESSVLIMNTSIINFKNLMIINPTFHTSTNNLLHWNELFVSVSKEVNICS